MEGCLSAVAGKIRKSFPGKVNHNGGIVLREGRGRSRHEKKGIAHADFVLYACIPGRHPPHTLPEDERFSTSLPLIGGLAR